ncbi:MAG: hypothetical protein A3D99_00010 [Candidatus Andersenbacteria bacterium RIFCSPHIGHO2_12_FULL_45_11]|uniref:Glycosyltransferase RgtA/B/C/D-like domain-containing protein n=1 Tax=Candidatus Andersenbacteria bacterium RIFCSPHIGHO2_12_FULL_45_11 TaxID=1797281 RepID=A0A1G1X2J7_9BACT|nr:MAG: hypothetical protein A3D99_00010 [Candidatus Andersenbacteria bacterium RIFCSPHIGHO2_12_FULL_45_11]
MDFGKQRIWWVALGCIIALAFAARMWVIPQFGGVSGGDAYNYLFITKSIIAGENPFTNTKRLPGYPITLIPAVLSKTIDIEHTMRTIQIVSAMWGICMVVLLARSIKLPWEASLLAATILAFQKDYFWTSMRPEPYTLYTALLLTALWLFIRGYQTPSMWRHIVFGIVLGYAAFTRQEGFMAAALLGVCSLGYELYFSFKNKTWKSSSARFLAMYIPALFVVSPFFISNTIAYKNPFYSPYLEGDRLQIVDSFLAFQDALGATWGIIDSMWKPAWDQLQRLDFTSELFITSALGIIGWYWYTRVSKHKKASPLPLLFISLAFGAGILFFYFNDELAFREAVPIMTAAWTIASIPLFLFHTRWKGALLLLIAISQIGIATWFHPFPKHYQQAYPIIILMLATVLCGNASSRRLPRISVPLAAAMPFMLVAVILSQHVNAAIDEANEDSALDSVIYRASRYVQDLPGTAGFDQAYLPAVFYFDPGLKYFDDEQANEDQKKQWIQQNNIKFLVVTNTTQTFEKPDPNWKVLKTFKAAGKRDFIFVSTVYAI